MANYVENHLIRGEHIEYKTTYHWIIFLHWKSILTLFIRPLLVRWSDEFAITNKRVIIKTGIISRETLEMNLSKIETVNVDQSIPGRIFGFGSITVVGTGGTRKIFENIRKPIEFRKKFQEMCDLYDQTARQTSIETANEKSPKK